MRYIVLASALALTSCTSENPLAPVAFSQCVATPLNFEIDLDFVSRQSNCTRHFSGQGSGPCCVYRTSRHDANTLSTCKVLTGRFPPSDDRNAEGRFNRVFVESEGWSNVEGSSNPDGAGGGHVEVYRFANLPTDPSALPAAMAALRDQGPAGLGGSGLPNYRLAYSDRLRALACDTPGCAKTNYDVHVFYDNPVPPANQGPGLDECPRSVKMQIGLSE